MSWRHHGFAPLTLCTSRVWPYWLAAHHASVHQEQSPHYFRAAQQGRWYFLCQGPWRQSSSALHPKRPWNDKTQNRTRGSCAIYDIRPKRSLNSNLTKSRLSITFVSIAWSLWNFAQSGSITAMLCAKFQKRSGNYKISHEQSRLREIWV